MDIESFILPGDVSYPCHITAKRYRPPPGTKALGSTTLVLAHGLGMHKETWEPTLEELFAKDGHSGIKEAWSVDAPNHGEAGALNRQWLAANWAESVPWDMYHAALGRFVLVAPEQVSGVPRFRELQNLVALGHSAGATALAWIHADPSYDIKFSTLVLLEPMITPPSINLAPFWHAASNAVYGRRDCWPSKEAAYADLKETPGYGKGWDERALKSYVQYNVVLHPASKYAMNPWDGVILATPKEQEAACCRAGQIPPAKIVKWLPEMVKGTSTHFIWGDKPMRLFKSLQTAVSKLVQGHLASEQWVPNTGHGVGQESPSGVSGAVYRCLVGSETTTAKL